MPTEDEEDSPFQGPALRPDGQITGRTPAATPPNEALEGRFGAVELPRAPSLELELVERGPKQYEPRVESFRPEVPPPRRGRGLKVALGALGLGVALLATFLLAPRPLLARVGLDGLRGEFDVGPLAFRRHSAPLLVQSTPSGATVTIAGKVVGVTPWAGDNVWPHEAPITVSLAGYSPWSATLREGVEQKLSVALKPRGKVTVDMDVGELDHAERPAP